MEHSYEGSKMAMNKYLSIITLNVNGLNAPIKIHWIAEWIRKHDSHICCLWETYSEKRPTQTESEDLDKNIPSKWTGKISHASNTQNRLQNKGHKRDPEGHFIIFKGRIHQEHINIVSIYASDKGAPNTEGKSWRTSRKILSTTQL